MSTRQLETLEKQLLEDSLAMFESRNAFARYMTAIFRDDFQVKPKYVFGYSLGETSMMVAQGVWSDFEGGSNTLNSSPLFGDKLSGPKNAVREYWGLTGDTKIVWSNYVLMATPAQVRECIKPEKRVYLTQINTPEEVLIAGEEAACQRVIKTLGCNAFPAPFDHLIHCETMRSQYGEIKKVNTLPTQNIPDITFYSAAEYKPIELTSEAIAHNIATGLCQELDFPKLVNRIWDDGAKIFIEAGAGGVCSRWIDKILGTKEHLTVSLNRRGMEDHTSIVKALAKLLSHRVSVDLSPLYSLSSATTHQSKLTQRKITLGGNSITATILSDENRQLFGNKTAQNSDENRVNYPEIPIINSLKAKSDMTLSEIRNHFVPEFKPEPAKIPMKTIIDNVFEVREQLQSSESTSVITPATTEKESSYTISMPRLNLSQYQKLNANHAKLTKAHTSFLQARQDFSQQMSEIIQLQLTCAQNLLNEEV